MKDIDMWVELGKVIIPLSFRHKETKVLFLRYEADVSDIKERIEYRDKDPVRISEERWTQSDFTEYEKVPGMWTEFYLLTGLVSRVLLEQNSCVFHSVAFMWQDYVWLLCAPSGTGKTTQWRHWCNLYGDEISLVSGDKPVISIEDQGVMVYSSPWNGKEEYVGSGLGKLGGIIFLEQAKYNEMILVQGKDMVIPLWDEFLFFAEKEDEIRAVAKIEDYILRHVPIWKLSNLGDEDSVMLTRKTLQLYIDEHLRKDT